MILQESLIVAVLVSLMSLPVAEGSLTGPLE